MTFDMRKQFFCKELRYERTNYMNYLLISLAFFFVGLYFLLEARREKNPRKRVIGLVITILSAIAFIFILVTQSILA